MDLNNNNNKIFSIIPSEIFSSIFLFKINLFVLRLVCKLFRNIMNKNRLWIQIIGTNNIEQYLININKLNINNNNNNNNLNISQIIKIKHHDFNYYYIIDFSNINMKQGYCE